MWAARHASITLLASALRVSLLKPAADAASSATFAPSKASALFSRAALYLTIAFAWTASAASLLIKRAFKGFVLHFFGLLKKFFIFFPSGQLVALSPVLASTA